MIWNLIAVFCAQFWAYWFDLNSFQVCNILRRLFDFHWSNELQFLVQGGNDYEIYVSERTVGHSGMLYH